MTRAFNEFLKRIFRNFFNFGKFVKIREFFFAEVTNSRSMMMLDRSRVDHILSEQVAIDNRSISTHFTVYSLPCSIAYVGLRLLKLLNSVLQCGPKNEATTWGYCV